MEIIVDGDTFRNVKKTSLSPKKNWFYNNGGKNQLLMDLRYLEDF